MESQPTNTKQFYFNCKTTVKNYTVGSLVDSIIVKDGERSIS